ncbi:hypothetical protein [Bacteroides propionicifaciens]|nr:hypothetical protein [Bacteroides propionicifaciens]
MKRLNIEFLHFFMPTELEKTTYSFTSFHLLGALLRVSHNLDIIMVCTI